MPLILDDATALMVFKALLRLPPTSGTVIVNLLQDMQASAEKTAADQGKLLLDLQQKVTQMSGTQVTQNAFDTEIAGIRADVAAQTTVENSFLVFAQGLAAKLADATANSDQAAALAAVQQIHSDLLANTKLLSDAMTTNTTAASEATAPVQPTTTVDSSTVSTSGTDTGTAAASGADSTGGASSGTVAAADDSGTQQPAS